MFGTGLFMTTLAVAALLPVPAANAEPAPPHASFAACREGSMVASGQGFYTCAQGRWVYRECGPGTYAQQIGLDQVICNY